MIYPDKDEFKEIFVGIRDVITTFVSGIPIHVVVRRINTNLPVLFKFCNHFFMSIYHTDKLIIAI